MNTSKHFAFRNINYIVIFLVLILFACNKLYNEPNEYDVVTKKEIAEVKNYLHQKEIDTEPSLKQRIAKANQSFDFNQPKQMMVSQDHKRILFVSLDKKYMLVAHYNISKQICDSINFLLLDNSTFDKSSSVINAAALVFDQRIIQFDGSIKVLNSTYSFAYELNFKNGIKKYTKFLKSFGKYKSVNKVKSNWDGGCIDWFYVTYYDDGSVTWQYLYTQCGFCEPNFFLPIDNEEMQIKILCSGGGGGGVNPSGNDPYFLVRSIFSNLTDSCLKRAYDNMMGIGIDNDLNDMIREAFGESKKINLIISQSPAPIYDDDFTELAGDSYTNYSNESEATVTVRLNLPFLQYASLELISATIYHEALHGYLRVVSGVTGNESQHNRMAESAYLNKFEASLRKIYPNSSSVDFSSLKWFGLGKTNSFVSLSEIEKQNIRQKIYEYKTGTGTGCR